MPDNNLKVLEKMLDVATFRQKLLTSNIANADTPGYKAKDISFQNELERAASGGPSTYEVHETVTTMENRDGNTVDLNIEMAKVTENTLLYNAASQIIATKLRMLKDAIRGGR